jgi:hypothetical protein
MFLEPGVRIFLLCFAATVALVAGNLVFAEQNREIPEVSKKLRKYDVLKLDPKSAAAQIRRNGKLVLKTSDRVFDLQLVPHDLRSNDYRSQVIESNGVARALPRDSVNTYKGFVSDMNGGQVRLTITDDSIEGAIITSNGRYFIQPARSLSKTATKDEFIFYNTQDRTQDAETFGTTLADQVAVEEDRTGKYVDGATISQVTASSINPLNPVKVVRLATEADAEYVAALGGASQANNHILSIMNQVDGIYQFELGITFQIVFQNTWTNGATDPYSSLNNFAVLNEFSEYWNANFQNVQRNLAHLWSGKTLDTPGTANLAAVCRFPRSAYSFVGRQPEDPANPITSTTLGLTAHEIGHNFGGTHPDISSGVPEIVAQCDRTIMQVRFGNTFCPYSRGQILGFVTNFGSCLSDLSTPPPSPPTCVDVPIIPGVAASGSLATTDCRSPSQGASYFADRYAFDGQAGQRLNIATSSSPGVEPVIYLIGPDGFVVAQDTVRMPQLSGSLTLPLTGRYVIEVTSSEIQRTGNYTITLSFDGCVLAVNPTRQHFAPGGGGGTINVTATGNNCGPGYQFVVWPNTATWLKPQTMNGSGSQTLNFTVDPNANVAGRRAFLVVGASFGSQKGGLSIPITQSGTGPDCVLTPIAFGETVNGTLSNTDCRSPLRGSNFDFADRYVFTATAGQEVAIDASPITTISGQLTLIGPTGRVVFVDVDGGLAFHSRIPGGSGMLKLGLAGEYVIEVTAGTPGFTGSYSFTLVNNEPPTLLAEESSDSAIALESVFMLRDPFPLATLLSLSPADPQTRIMLIADNFALLSNESHSIVTAVAEDNLLNSYPLTIEFIGKVPGFGRLTQIALKLPPNLPPGQEVRVSVSLRGKTSNKVRFRIK